MSSHKRVLAAIEQSNLVSADVLAQLRRRIEKSIGSVDLKSAVKWLVEKGHITAAQAQRLLAEHAASAGGPTTAAPSVAAPAAPQAARPPAAADDDDLELAPLDDEQPSRRPGRAVSSEDFELFPSEPPSADPDATRVWDAMAKDERPARPTAPPSLPPSPPSRAPAPAASSSRWAGTRKSPPAPPAAPSGQSAAASAGALGGLDDLFSEALLGDPALSAGSGPWAQEERAPPRQKKNIWDSPLLLVCGGALALFIIVGFVLSFLLVRETGDQVLAQAEADYKSGSYSQAISKFTHYLEKFPKHSGVSLARVHLGLARLRQSVNSADDWPKTLATAKEIVGAIAKENEFPDARSELAALLPTIAEGLAAQAREKPAAALVAQTREALAMVDKYVPKTLRPGQRLLDVEASLALTNRALDRGNKLAETLERMSQAIAPGAQHNTQHAYLARKQLLKTYPDLARDESLLAAVLAVSKAERDAVQFVQPDGAAAVAAPAAPVSSTVVLAHRAGSAAPGVKDEVMFVLAGGAAYGLEAASGRVLWRRFVGFDTHFVPLPISPDAASDAILIDGRRREIARVDPRTGQPHWTYAVDAPQGADQADGPLHATAALLGDRVLVAVRSGRLIWLDAKTGQSPGFVQLPQKLQVGPAFDSAGRLMYQLGEHANLFVVSADDHQCLEVLYLGHEPESIRVPPLVVSRYVIVAENRGADDSVLRVLLTEADGLSLRPIHEEPLAGHVLAPIEVAGRRLVVATDRGAVSAFELAPPGEGAPLTKIAEKPAEDGPRLIRYPLLRDARLWVAGTDLTKYDIQSAAGRLGPQWIKDEGDAFQQQPRLVGDVVLHVRQEDNLPGAKVSAVSEASGERVWETHLGVPSAGEPAVDTAAGKVRVLNAAGALFEVRAEMLKGEAVQDTAVAAIGVDEPFPQGVPPAVIGSGRLALATGGQSQALIAELEPDYKLRWLKLPDTLTSSPIGFRGGLVSPGLVGQVFVVDVATGRNLVEPFQPRLENGIQYSWSRAASLDNDELLIADGRTRLYRLGVADEPQPAHLVARAEADLEGPVTAPVAAVGEAAYAVDGSGRLRSFHLPDLKPGPDWPLGGRCVLGPLRVGSHVLVATTHNELLCFDGRQQLVWQATLSSGSLAGPPLEVEGGYLLASITGVVQRIAADSGKQVARLDVGQPLSAGPVAWADGVLLMAHDGTVLVTARP